MFTLSKYSFKSKTFPIEADYWNMQSCVYLAASESKYKNKQKINFNYINNLPKIYDILLYDTSLFKNDYNEREPS